MLDEQTGWMVYDLLNFIGEALAHLQALESEELRQLVADGRQQVRSSRF